MSGLFPKDVIFEQVGWQSNTPGFRSRAHSGKSYGRLFGGQYFSFTARFARMTKTNFRPIDAFIMKQNGVADTFSIVPPDTAIPGSDITLGGQIALDGREVGAWLVEDTAETLVGSEALTNGTFDTDTDWTKDTGWTIGSGVASCSTVSSDIKISADSNPFSGFSAGDKVVIEWEVTSYTSGTVQLNIQYMFGPFINCTATGIYAYTHTITGSEGTLDFRSVISFVGSIDNVSVRLADPDVSDAGNGLKVFGSITKAAVNTGSGLVGYSNWSNSNYLKQIYNSDLDYGTGDCFYSLWYKGDNAGGYLIDRNDSGGSGPRSSLYVGTTNVVATMGGKTATYTFGNNIRDGEWHHLLMKIESSYLYLFIDSVQVAISGSTTTTVTNTSADTFIGVRYDLAGSVNAYVNLSLVATGPFAPTADEIKRVYDIESQLFDANEPLGIIPKVNGASQTGNEVVCDGYPASTLVHEAGDVVAFGTGPKMYKVIAPVTSDSSGNATIPINPALIVSPEDNASVVYYNVPLKVAMTGPIHKYDVSPPMLHTYELDLEEAV